VEVHLLHRHLVDARLGLREPLEQRFGSRFPAWRQRGPVDQRPDFRQASMVVLVPMRMGMRVEVALTVFVGVRVSVFVNPVVVLGVIVIV
jgi:hypothetical protein